MNKTSAETMIDELQAIANEQFWAQRNAASAFMSKFDNIIASLRAAVEREMSEKEAGR